MVVDNTEQLREQVSRLIIENKNDYEPEGITTYDMYGILDDVVKLIKAQELKARFEELNAVPMNEVRRLSDYRFERREKIVAELKQLTEQGEK